MTAEPFHVGAYWGSRPEPVEACAERLRRLLTGLAEAHPALATWYRKGTRKSAATTPVAADPAALVELLNAGRNRADVGGGVLAELGFSFGLWHRDPVEVGLAGTVGYHAGNPHLMNSVVLDLPIPAGAGAELYDPAVAERVMAAIVSAWEPDWATWTSWPLREAQTTAPREPVAGWLTYLGPSRAAALNGRTPATPLGEGVLLSLGGPAASANPAAAVALRRGLPPKALGPTPL
ncbi:Imm52 family immunity protein [Actinokineospora sp. HUAS TT18]|uniref:Imm52 family immunity protein n=1 Tax=Actinokineospora sp. HUAS TT18 TaxID=3447451 RepID=UPI003F52145C